MQEKTNDWLTEWMDEYINKSINQSINQSIDQSINEYMNRLIISSAKDVNEEYSLDTKPWWLMNYLHVASDIDE